MSYNKEVKREACPGGKSLRRVCYKRRLKAKERATRDSRVCYQQMQRLMQNMRIEVKKI